MTGHLLHSNEALFLQIIREIEKEKQINSVFLEKDYWICATLKNMIEKPLGKYLIFKGGTALSKVHAISKRFSEDVDLTIDTQLWREDTGTTGYDSIKKKALRGIYYSVDHLPVDTNSLEYQNSPGGNIRKLPLIYPAHLQHQHSVINKHILLEITANRNEVPYSLKTVSSYIYDYLKEKNQEELINQYRLEPISVKVVTLERTICDKIFRLNKLRYYHEPIEKIIDKSRDIYDLHKIISHPDSQEFFSSDRFIQELKAVESEELYEKIQKESYQLWRGKPMSGSLLFKYPEFIMDQYNVIHDRVAPLLFEPMPDAKELTDSFRFLSAQTQRYDLHKGNIEVDLTIRLAHIHAQTNQKEKRSGYPNYRRKIKKTKRKRNRLPTS